MKDFPVEAQSFDGTLSLFSRDCSESLHATLNRNGTGGRMGCGVEDGRGRQRFQRETYFIGKTEARMMFGPSGSKRTPVVS